MKSNYNASSLHERFEELAALAAVGEVNAFELKYLREHLTECQECREAYQAFANVAYNELGVTATDYESTDSAPSPKVSAPEPQESLREFYERLKRKQEGAGMSPTQPKSLPAVENTFSYPSRGFFSPKWAYGIAAVFLLMIATSVGMMWHRSAKTIFTERLHSQQLQAVVESLKQEKSDGEADANAALTHSLEDTIKDLDALQQERDGLKRALMASELKVTDLLQQENADEGKLTQAIAEKDQLRQQLQTNSADRERLARLQQESDGKLHEALAELYQARQSGVQTTGNANVQEAKSVPVQALSESAGATATSLPGELEARNLFGARDLHIVDVYDVTGDGKTKRAYGRVYYVEKKLLVFYAFDLQDQQNHKRGVFQAWGIREANATKAIDLGLFAVDSNNGSVNRWVFTVSRPDVLSHIDVVCVTAEPLGGSTTPRGRKILYANLAWPANHP